MSAAGLDRSFAELLLCPVLYHSNCSVELRSVCHAHDTGFVACEEVFRGVKNAMRPGPVDKDGLGHDAFDLVVLFLNAALGEL